MKKLLLLISAALLGINFGTNAQGVYTGSNSSSSYYNCDSGAPKANGWNYYGQLGDGTTVNKLAPTSVNGLAGVTSIAAGWGYAIFLKSNGTVWASGSNYSGQLGATPTEDFTTSPVQISGLSNIIAIAAGSDHSLFLKSNGTVWACGRNLEGQLGIGGNDSTGTPTQVPGLSAISAIGAGQFCSYFVKSDGSVMACGWNGAGQLGNGSYTSVNTVVEVTGLTGITEISGGYVHTLFLKNDGTVWAAGNNSNAQFGNGSYSSTTTPIQVSTLSGITSVKAGYYHSIYLKNDGTAWGSGANAYGQIGSGSTSLGYNPLQVEGLTGVTGIAAGRSHSLFLKNDGSIWATGYNAEGELGDHTVVTRTSPVLVLAAGDCQTVGILEAVKPFSSLSIYPNPATNRIVIDTKVQSHNATFKIYNAIGQELVQASANVYSGNQETSVDVSSLSPGVYFILLFDGENQSRAKFVKE